jgi:hypothetical protein
MAFIQCQTIMYLVTVTYLGSLSNLQQNFLDLLNRVLVDKYVKFCLSWHLNNL